MKKTKVIEKLSASEYLKLTKELIVVLYNKIINLLLSTHFKFFLTHREKQPFFLTNLSQKKFRKKGSIYSISSYLLLYYILLYYILLYYIIDRYSFVSTGMSKNEYNDRKYNLQYNIYRYSMSRKRGYNERDN